MIILGLHFGHDASVSVIKDGEVLLSLEIERHARIKKVTGIEYSYIKMALADCDLKEKDLDYAALTSTQYMDYVFPAPEKLCTKIEQLPEHKNTLAP